jgi:alkanesulfonate monooxygenase SsuD/methylene tetrahydromethanopterin reductase-like flavin-dependent oxidoreductase (luciferase family)
VRFGLDIAQHQLSWDELRDRARLGERLGFDGAWVFDHFKALYGDPSGPCLEGWTLLSALAASTERIRLGTLVTGVTYRPPALLASEAITVDHVSHGRLEVGVGAAWHGREHHELGFAFPGALARIERVEEAVGIIKLLSTMDDVTYIGRHYRVEGATYRPRPVQQPHPPIWIGGGGERFMLPVVARVADYWHGFGSVSELTRKSRLLDQLAEKAGRDPGSIGRTSSLSLSEPRPSVQERIESLAAAGFSYLTVSWPSEGSHRVEEFAHDVMPLYLG